MTVTVTAAQSPDTPAIATLMREMDAFYGEPTDEPTEAKMHQITSVLFSEPPLAYAILARDGERVIGFAAYSFLWPAVSSTKSLYLKELYVSASYRKRGIGRLLMAEILRTAVDNECSRVEWTTDETNTSARQFYARLGLRELSSKVFYRVDGPALLTAVANS